MALPLLSPEDCLDKDRYTEDEYFAVDDRSHVRWEFLPDASGLGRIRAMSGGTPDHSAVAMNLGVALTNALRGAGNRVCRVFNSDLKVHTADGHNTYPDVSVVCGGLTFHRGRRDIVTNPILVAEVLSPATDAYDRGDKLLSYQTVPSLQHALLLAADRARVEVYTRQSSGWHFQTCEGLAAEVPLNALGVTLSLTDLYDLVEFGRDDAP